MQEMKYRTILFICKILLTLCYKVRLTGGCCPVWIALGRSQTGVTGDSDDSYKQIADSLAPSVSYIHFVNNTQTANPREVVQY